jgi:hypothetical protein
LLESDAESLEILLWEVFPVRDDSRNFEGISDVIQRVVREEDEIGDSARLYRAKVVSLL